MKKSPLILIILLSFSFSFVYSQSDSSRHSLGLIPKVDVLLPIVGLTSNESVLSFSIEKELGKQTSLQLSFFYSYFSYSNVGIDSLVQKEVLGGAWSEYRIVPEFDYYFNKIKNHRGFYTGVYIDFVYDHSIENDAYINAPTVTNNIYTNSLAIGLLGGYKLYVYKRINIDFLLGLGSGRIINTKVISGSDAVDHGPFYGNINLDGIININVGYRF
jgi:hypothetical protein